MKRIKFTVNINALVGGICIGLYMKSWLLGIFTMCALAILAINHKNN